jgi:hypothetical protein
MNEETEEAVDNRKISLAQDAVHYPPACTTEFDDPIVPKWRLILLSMRYFPNNFPKIN